MERSVTQDTRKLGDDCVEHHDNLAVPPMSQTGTAGPIDGSVTQVEDVRETEISETPSLKEYVRTQNAYVDDED